MNIDEILNKNKLLEEELQKTKDELIKTSAKLKKYTSPISNKIYYENNKEAHIKRVMEHRAKTNYIHIPTPEKRKEYARTAYLNKKEKLKNLEKKENNNENENENI
jgi:5-formyltetrahydrofolate cyclo-ligase